MTTTPPAVDVISYTTGQTLPPQVLPDLHAGHPGYGTVEVHAILVRETERAYLIAQPHTPDRIAWVPKAGTWKNPQAVGYIVKGAEVFAFDVKVWAYRRAVVELRGH